MRTQLLLAVLLAAPVFAGCVGSDEAAPSGENASSPTGAAAMEEVSAALAENASSVNLRELGHWANSPAQEADPWGEYLFVSRGDRVAILDVSDPEHPSQVSEVTDVPASLDVKVSDDGRYLFVGDDQEASGDPQGGTGPLTGGIYVFDVRDKENPERVEYEAVGNQRGPHMVFYHNHTDGNEYVYAAAGDDVVIHQFIRSEEVLQEVARYTPGQLAQNRDPNVVGAYYNSRGWLHDMFVSTQPDGSTLMFVAAWDAGLHVVDVTDPDQPEQVGAWSDFADDESGNVHTVVTGWVGDRRITVGSVEVGFLVVGGTQWAMESDKSVLYVWDTTDAEDPVLLSRWVNPIDATSGRNAFAAGTMPGEELTSTHNAQLENGRIYLAHYGLGVWVLDVSSDANLSDPEVLAYYNGDEMDTWDVVLNNGVVYSSGGVGVKAFGFPLEPIGPNGTTSRA